MDKDLNVFGTPGLKLNEKVVAEVEEMIFSSKDKMEQLFVEFANALQPEKDTTGYTQMLICKLEDTNVPYKEKMYIVDYFRKCDCSKGHIDVSDMFKVDMAIHDLADQFLWNSSMPKYEADKLSIAIRSLINCDYDCKYDFLCQLEKSISDNLHLIDKEESQF